jgi:hypothetical protein
MSVDPTAVLTWLDTPEVLTEIRLRKLQFYSRIVEQLSYRLNRLDGDERESQIIGRIGQLSDSSFERIALAPETHYRLTAPPSQRDGSTAELIRYLESSINAEELRNGRTFRLSGPVWTSLGDHCYSHNGCERVSCSYSAPVVSDTIVIDSMSPTSRRRSDGSVIEDDQDTVQPAISTEDFARELGGALQEISNASPVTRYLIETHLKVIVLQNDPRNPRFSTISGRAFAGQAIFRNVSGQLATGALLIDLLIHESIHSYLYAVEQKQPWMRNIYHNGTIQSPWTNNHIRIDSYLHACFVWFGLIHFWKYALDCDAFDSEIAYPFYHRAYVGFSGANPAQALEPWRDNIDNDVLDQIGALSSIVQDIHGRP